MVTGKTVGAIVAGVVSIVVVTVLVLVIVLPSGKGTSAGFTGVKIFTDPDGLEWSGSYYVYRSQPLLPVSFEGQGDSEKIIDCSSEYRMQINVGLDYPYTGSITIQAWVRGEIRETASVEGYEDAQVQAIC